SWVLVSCRHSTSGAHSEASRRTFSIRIRIELIFQVTRRNVDRDGCQPRTNSARHNGARSGGKTGRQHVRSASGKSGPQGRRDRSKENRLALSASGWCRWGAPEKKQTSIRAYPKR